MKRRFRLFAGLVSFGMLAAACGGTGATTSQSPGATVKEGGVFRVGSTSTIDSLNPFVAFNSDSYTTFMYIYPYLVMYAAGDPTKFAGDLATSWSVSADGKDWTFTLRPGATWSDGQPLDSSDAAFTFNTYLKYEKGPASYYAGIIAHLQSVDAPDPTTFVMHYDVPVANVIYQMQQAPILPPQTWASYATGDGKGLKTFANNPPPVSGGPFELKDYVKGQSAVFTRNPNWYGEKPHIDEWGFRFYSNDDAEVTGLKNGEIDAIETAPPTQVTSLKAAGFTIDELPGVEFKDFIFNSNPSKPNNKELLDPQVRLAIAHAIDRNRIVQTSYLGYAKPADSIISPASGIWHDPSLHPETFDLALANQLLDQAGYAKGADGIRTANGHPMTYQVIFPQSESGTGDRTFQIIQSDLQQIGIKITQRTLDDSAAFDAILAPNNKYLTYDLSMWDWIPYVADPDFILSVLTCAQYGGWSDSAYCNPQYDQLYKQQAVTVDQQQRVKIVYQMQEMIYDARPYVAIVYPDVLEAVAKNWTGFVPDAGAGSFSSDSKFSLIRIHQK